MACAPDVTNILLTRPGEPGRELAKMLEKQGFHAEVFPLIKIAPCAVEPLPEGFDADMVIFVSKNAVRYAALKNDLQQKKCLLAAVGKATMSALQNLGLEVSIVPEHRFDSEGLLAHPQLQQVAGRKILIVRGKGGREKLRQELQKRGASVRYYEVYQRLPIDYAPQQINHLLYRDIHLVQVSNQQSLDLLLPLVKKASWFAKAHWLVLSERTARACRQAGIACCQVIAPGNEALTSYLQNNWAKQ